MQQTRTHTRTHTKRSAANGDSIKTIENRFFFYVTIFFWCLLFSFFSVQICVCFSTTSGTPRVSSNPPIGVFICHTSVCTHGCSVAFVTPPIQWLYAVHIVFRFCVLCLFCFFSLSPSSSSFFFFAFMLELKKFLPLLAGISFIPSSFMWL